jgi:hypothetical protein
MQGKRAAVRAEECENISVIARNFTPICRSGLSGWTESPYGFVPMKLLERFRLWRIRSSLN